MFDKLNQINKKIEEIKARLDHVYVTGDSANGMVKIQMNGNKKLTDVSINESFHRVATTEELQDQIYIAFNKAMEQAENVNETELRSAAGSMLPGFGL